MCKCTLLFYIIKGIDSEMDTLHPDRGLLEIKEHRVCLARLYVGRWSYHLQNWRN